MNRILVAMLVIGIIGVEGGVAQMAETKYNPAGTVPSSYFGLTIHHANASWPSFPVNSLRMWDVSSWNSINTSNGSYTWTKVDNYVAFEKSHGVKDILFTLGNTPTWASSKPSDTTCYEGSGACYPPASTTYWTTFVTELTRRYCGTIKYYELWDEPDSAGFWKGTPAQLASLAQAAYPIIHSTANCACDSTGCGVGHSGSNPNVVLSPSVEHLTDASWMQKYVAAGGAKYFDVLAYHGYGYTKTPEGYLGDLSVLKMHAAGGGSPAGKSLPIWNTEGSWGKDADLPAVPDQVAWIGRAYLTMWPLGVSRYYWYAYDNNAWGTMWAAGSGENAVATAYGQLQKWMVGASESCTHYNISAWVCTLSRTSPSGYRGYAVWNTSGSATYKIPNGVVQYRDLAGNKTATTGGRDITVSSSPLLFETGNAW